MGKSIVYAVILSGGSGNRFRNNLPKQFADVYGKTILDYCISNFDKHEAVDKIIVVSNPEHIQRTMQVAKSSKFKKVISIVEGGATRGESSYIGLREIVSNEDNVNNVKVLIQDGVRPNTKANIIDNVIESLNVCKAVSVAIPTTDTIYITNGERQLDSIPERSKLFKAQTPQGFDFNLIFSAYEKLKKVERFKLTDDCSIINEVYPNELINVIEGDINNIKITFSEDLEYFKQILQSKS